MLGFLDRVQHATLTGFPLMLVMLACFLAGALSMRFALELDAKALWAFILSKKPAAASAEKVEGDERE